MSFYATLFKKFNHLRKRHLNNLNNYATNFDHFKAFKEFKHLRYDGSPKEGSPRASCSRTTILWSQDL